MIFLNPSWFWALPFILLYALIYIWRVKRRKEQGLPFPRVNTLKRLHKPVSIYRRHLPFIIRLIVLVLVVIALARPQGEEETIKQPKRGIEIMLALDVSGSMRAEDFKPVDRLHASKIVIDDFIAGFKGENKIGLVLFAKRSFTQCPLTFDHKVLREQLDRVEHDSVPLAGTAIGDAILTSLYRLGEDNGDSKTIVLLTDGEDNSSRISPEDAAKIAARRNVRVFTIGVGTPGGAPIPRYIAPGIKEYSRDPQTGRLIYTKLDEGTLKDIAEITGGRYFAARDFESLADIYKQIARIQTRMLEERSIVIYKELFVWFAVPALILMLMELVLTAGSAHVLRFRKSRQPDMRGTIAMNGITVLPFMNFWGDPVNLGWLFIVPILILIIAVMAEMRKKKLGSQVDGSLLKKIGYLIEHLPVSRLKAGLFLVGMILLIVALARPLGAPTQAARIASGSDLMIVLDVSESMLVQDFRPDNRLEASRVLLHNLLGMLPGNRVGLVIFAGNPVTWSPLTLDRSAVEAFLDRASPDSIPLKGTSLEAAIREAAASLAAGRGGTVRSDRSQAVLLVTDGEDHAGDIPAVISYAKEQGLPIYTLGVGTEKGGPVPQGVDFFGRAQYKYFNGRLVNSRLEPDNLKKLADETGGKYFYADSNDVVRRLAAAISSLNKAVVLDADTSRRNELFQFPLLLCLVLLFVEGLIPEIPVILKGGMTA